MPQLMQWDAQVFQWSAQGLRSSNSERTDDSNYQTKVLQELLELRHIIILMSHFCLYSWASAHHKIMFRACTLHTQFLQNCKKNSNLKFQWRNNTWDNNDHFNTPALESTNWIPEWCRADVSYMPWASFDKS